MGLKSSKSDVNANANTTDVKEDLEKRYPDLSVTVTDKYYNLGDKHKYVSVDGQFDDQKVVADLLVALWDRVNK